MKLWEVSMQVVRRKLWLTRTSVVRRGGNWGKFSDSWESKLWPPLGRHIGISHNRPLWTALTMSVHIQYWGDTQYDGPFDRFENIATVRSLQVLAFSQITYFWKYVITTDTSFQRVSQRNKTIALKRDLASCLLTDTTRILVWPCPKDRSTCSLPR